MANFSGRDLSPAFGANVAPANLSPNVSTATLASVSNSRGIDRSVKPILRATPGAIAPVSVASWTSSGTKTELFGGELFGKIIVSPRSKSLGFVLSATQFNVDVWSTFRDEAKILEAIQILGDGGLTIANPYSLPLAFFPFQSRTFQATIPSTGAARVDNDAVFVFSGGVAGADLVVTGSRITLFSLAPDWSRGMRERISYLTEILTAYSDAEQRRSLRKNPRRSLAFRVVTMTPRAAAGLDALLWGWQHQAYGVPFWPDAYRLQEDVAAGSYLIPVDTADRLFAAGGLACLWSDQFTFEALTIKQVNAGSIEVSAPTQYAWKGKGSTFVLPVFLMRLSDSVELTRIFSGGDEMELEFSGEGGQVSPASGSVALTQYRGIDVLEVPPNWREPLRRRYARSLIVLDSKTGGITVDDRGGSALVGTSLPWFIGSHPEVTKFRAFIDSRRGRRGSFWMPTWDQDLILAQAVTSADTGIRIQAVTYTRFFFANKARRHLMFISADGKTRVYRQVIASVDNGDGTETLTLDSAIGVKLAAASTMISFLTLARLESDDVEINWTSSELAEAVLSTVEIPREVS